MPASPASSVCFRLSPEGALKPDPAGLAHFVLRTPGAFWLDSADATPGQTAWSFLGLQPTRVVTGGVRATADLARRRDAAATSPACLELLQQEWRAHRTAAPAASGPPARQPPFRGGWFLLLSYDLGREIEHLPRRAVDDLPFPGLYLAFHEVVLAFDHREGAWWAACLISRDVPRARREPAARHRVDALLSRLPAAPAAPRRAGPASPMPARRPDTLAPAAGARRPSGAEAFLPAGFSSNFTRPAYEAAVARVLEYIAAGDAYQVNLSQRFRVPWRAPALDLYLALRQQSPSRYGVFANLGDGRAVCSTSPELFLSVRGRECVTRPIKGTRPRGLGPAQDARLKRELEASAKDRAELAMIVDLERNDLGRVCEYGSVAVQSAGALETHPTVFHRVATVTGRLRARASPVDLLRAAFPGGSVTGAPKVRAMEIIEELEPTRRGPYCGALGWLGVDGDLELNLAIRTALSDQRSGQVWYQAGGGIVADSEPAREYEETLVKAAAFFRACGDAPRPALAAEPRGR